MTPEEIKAWENTIGAFVCQGAVAIIVLALAIRIALDIFKKGEED
jgi:hypothetical protein